VRPPHSTPTLRIALLSAIAASAGLLIFFGCSSRPTGGDRAGGTAETGIIPIGQSSLIPGVRLDPADFVGSEACAECHPGEFESHRHTNHAKTLRPADARSLGPLAPPAGPIGDSGYSVRMDGNKLRFARRDRPDDSAGVQYALGAGKTVMTFIGEVTTESLTEFRMSYAPSTRKWFVTPGQESMANVDLGRTYELEMASRCILCHGDKVDAKTGQPAPGFIGIGCESCHGPGRAHVAAIKTGQQGDVRMERLGQASGARINEICGRCHRTTADVELADPNACNSMRFQPYGLERSPCFKQSNGRLTCVTCHDPHKDAATDARHYEAICLSCHSSVAKKGTVCPVNPRDKCVGCHMPKREILPGTSIHLKMADHLIWAYPSGRKNAQ
jgi:hypothetical protein